MYLIHHLTSSSSPSSLYLAMYCIGHLLGISDSSSSPLSLPPPLLSDAPQILTFSSPGETMCFVLEFSFSTEVPYVSLVSAEFLRGNESVAAESTSSLALHLLSLIRQRRFPVLHQMLSHSLALEKLSDSFPLHQLHLSADNIRTLWEAIACTGEASLSIGQSLLGPQLFVGETKRDEGEGEGEGEESIPFLSSPHCAGGIYYSHCMEFVNRVHIPPLPSGGQDMFYWAFHLSPPIPIPEPLVHILNQLTQYNHRLIKDNIPSSSSYFDCLLSPSSPSPPSASFVPVPYLCLSSLILSPALIESSEAMLTLISFIESCIVMNRTLSFSLNALPPPPSPSPSPSPSSPLYSLECSSVSRSPCVHIKKINICPPSLSFSISFSPKEICVISDSSSSGLGDYVFPSSPPFSIHAFMQCIGDKCLKE